ncbi:MAG: Veg family protein [Clostridia bacterium]|nr:Veg family protein [Clostridia bacterium]
MIEKTDLMMVKAGLQKHVGKKIRLTAKKGRKRAVVRRGTIENLYPSIFTIRLDNLPEDETEQRCVSFSYADVLTKNVEIAIYKTQEQATEA